MTAVCNNDLIELDPDVTSRWAARGAHDLAVLAEGRVVARGTAREVFTPALVERVFDATVSVIDDGGDLVIVPRRQR